VWFSSPNYHMPMFHAAQAIFRLFYGLFAKGA